MENLGWKFQEQQARAKKTPTRLLCHPQGVASCRNKETESRKTSLWISGKEEGDKREAQAARQTRCVLNNATCAVAPDCLPLPLPLPLTITTIAATTATAASDNHRV